MATYSGTPVFSYSNGHVTDSTKVPLLVDLNPVTITNGSGTINYIAVYTKNGNNISVTNFQIQDLIAAATDTYLVYVHFECAFDYVVAQVFYTDGESEMSNTLTTFCPPGIPTISTAIEDVSNNKVVVILENNTANNPYSAFLELRYNIYYNYTDTSGNFQFGSSQSVRPTYDNDASGSSSSYRYAVALESMPNNISNGTLFVNAQEVIRITSGDSTGVEITGPLSTVSDQVETGEKPFAPTDLDASGYQNTLDVTLTFNDSLHQSLVPINRYEILRADGSNEPFAYIGFVEQDASVGGTHTFVDNDSGISSGIEYRYQVYAVSVGGVSSELVTNVTYSGDGAGVDGITFESISAINSMTFTQTAAESDASLGPQVTIEWNETQTDVSQYEVFADGSSLGVVAFTSTGTYAITHDTDFGDVSYSYTIVSTAPNGETATTDVSGGINYELDTINAPQNVTVTQDPSGEPTLTVSWSAPDNTANALLVKYEVYDGSLNNLLQVDVSADITSWTTGILGSGVHPYYVRAVGVNGTFTNSSDVEGTILNPQAPAVTSSTFEFTSDPKIQLTWNGTNTANDLSNPDIDAYTDTSFYTVYDYNGEDPSLLATIQYTSDTAYTYTDGTATDIGTTYTYVVTATTLAGSEYNLDASFTATIETINAPTDVSLERVGTTDDIQISWTAPANNGLTAHLVNYSIFDGSHNLIDNVASDASSYRISEQETGVLQTYYVRANGLQSTSTNSSNATITLPDAATIDYTDASTNISFSINSGTKLSDATLSWTTPTTTDDDTDIEKYYIYFSSGTDVDGNYGGAPVLELAGNATSALLQGSDTSGMAYNIAFNYRVYSLTSYDVNNYSNTVNTDVFANVPYELVSFTTPLIDTVTDFAGAQTQGASSIDLSWGLPPNAGIEAELTNFIISYSNIDTPGTVVTQSLNSIDASSYTLSVNAGTYNLKMISVGLGGETANHATEEKQVVVVNTATAPQDLTLNGASETVYGTFKNPISLNNTDPSYYQIELLDASSLLLIQSQTISYDGSATSYSFDFDSTQENPIVTPGEYKVTVQLMEETLVAGDSEIASNTVVTINRPVIVSFEIDANGVINNTVIYGNNLGSGELLDLIIVPISGSGDAFYKITTPTSATDDPDGNHGTEYTYNNIALSSFGANITAGDVTGALVFAANSSGVSTLAYSIS